MCALLKKPNIPILVSNASATTAGTKYSFITILHRSQYLRSQTVVVTLAISNTLPIMIMGITAPAKIAVKPMILYHAAIELSASATNSVALLKENKFLNID